MAKVLEALERARLERLKTLQAGDPSTEASLLGTESPLTESSVQGRAVSGGGLSTISEQIVGVHDNQSPIAEQVRQIRTNLETVLSEYRSRSIVVTSPVSGDGKTLVTANLASVLADDPEHQVVLVDADMRRPEQHNLFGLPPAPGLADYLSGRCPLESALHDTGIPNLKLMPAGRGVAKPTVLLSSEKMLSLLGDLQRSYRWVIFDTPPLLPVSDASVLARECVGLILVVRMGQTHRNTIQRAQELLAEMRLPILGCILNDFTQKSRENSYYYHYYAQGERRKKKK